jgi:hypothetical protein
VGGRCMASRGGRVRKNGSQEVESAPALEANLISARFRLKISCPEVTKRLHPGEFPVNRKVFGIVSTRREREICNRRSTINLAG